MSTLEQQSRALSTKIERLLAITRTPAPEIEPCEEEDSLLLKIQELRQIDSARKGRERQLQEQLQQAYGRIAKLEQEVRRLNQNSSQQARGKLEQLGRQNQRLRIENKQLKQKLGKRDRSRSQQSESMKSTKPRVQIQVHKLINYQNNSVNKQPSEGQGDDSSSRKNLKVKPQYLDKMRVKEVAKDDEKEHYRGWLFNRIKKQHFKLR